MPDAAEKQRRSTLSNVLLFPTLDQRRIYIKLV